MGGSPEAVESEALRVAGHAQTALADQPGAEQRRQLHVAGLAAQREAVARVGQREVRVAPVDLVAGERGLVAEILAAAGAVATAPAGGPQPGNADALPRLQAVHAGPAALHPAHDLVAGNDGQPHRLELAVDDVQVGPAHAAGADPHEHLTAPRLRHRALDQLQISARPRELHRPHAHGRQSSPAAPLRASRAATALRGPARR